MKREMDLGHIVGLMGHDMRADGKMIWLMVLEYFSTQMEINTKVNFLMINLMDMENILIQTVKNMKASGKMICKMAKE